MSIPCEDLSVGTKSKVKYQGHYFRKKKNGRSGGIGVSQRPRFLSFNRYCAETKYGLRLHRFQCLTLYPTIPSLIDLETESFENIVGKGENAGNQHFLLFPAMFSNLSQTEFHQLSNIKFVVCKYFRFGKGQKFVVW